MNANSIFILHVNLSDMLYIWLFSMIFNIRMNQNGKKCYTGTCFMLRYCFTPQLDNELNLYCYSQKKITARKNL